MGASRRDGAPGGGHQEKMDKVCILVPSSLSMCFESLTWSFLPSFPRGLFLPPSPLHVLQVKATMYLTYLRAVGAPLCLYVLFLFLCQQVASFCSSYWLSLWADDPTVDGRQTQAALRGSIFGLLGCLQGTPCWPSSLSILPAPSEVLRDPWSACPWLTISFLNIRANTLALRADLHPSAKAWRHGGHGTSLLSWSPQSLYQTHQQINAGSWPPAVRGT